MIKSLGSYGTCSTVNSKVSRDSTAIGPCNRVGYCAIGRIWLIIICSLQRKLKLEVL